MHNKMYYNTRALYLKGSIVLAPYVSIEKSSVQKSHVHEYTTHYLLCVTVSILASIYYIGIVFVVLAWCCHENNFVEEKCSLKVFFLVKNMIYSITISYLPSGNSHFTGRTKITHLSLIQIQREMKITPYNEHAPKWTCWFKEVALSQNWV